jgi:MarR family transcriptional regulator, organic hydroperoxide resistance regulator
MGTSTLCTGHVALSSGAAGGGVAGDAAAAAQVLRHFRCVFSAVKAHFRRVEKLTGVGGALVWAMSVIDREPGIGVSALARRMDIHQSTTSNLVKTLIERDMVEGVREGRDRRTVHLHLRAAGRAVLLKAPEPMAGVLQGALGKLDTATLRRLDHDLGMLTQAFGEPTHGERDPMLPV